MNVKHSHSSKKSYFSCPSLSVTLCNGVMFVVILSFVTALVSSHMYYNCYQKSKTIIRNFTINRDIIAIKVEKQGQSSAPASVVVDSSIPIILSSRTSASVDDYPYCYNSY